MTPVKWGWKVREWSWRLNNDNGDPEANLSSSRASRQSIKPFADIPFQKSKHSQDHFKMFH